MTLAVFGITLFPIYSSAMFSIYTSAMFSIYTSAMFSIHTSAFLQCSQYTPLQAVWLLASGLSLCRCRFVKAFCPVCRMANTRVFQITWNRTPWEMFVVTILAFDCLQKCPDMHLCALEWIVLGQNKLSLR